MLLKKILQRNYTLNQKVYQLKLPFDIDCIIPSNDSVRLPVSYTHLDVYKRQTAIIESFEYYFLNSMMTISALVF